MLLASVVEGVGTLGGGGGESSGDGVRMGVGVLKVGEGVVRLPVLVFAWEGRMWIVQVRIGDLA